MLTQGTDSVMVYYSKIRDLWGEIDATIPSPSCSYEEPVPYAEHIKQQGYYNFSLG